MGNSQKLLKRELKKKMYMNGLTLEKKKRANAMYIIMTFIII